MVFEVDVPYLTSLAPRELANDPIFTRRFQAHIPRLLSTLQLLYGGRDDFREQTEQIVTLIGDMYRSRPAAMRELDQIREQKPDWYLNNKMVGAVCYVDLFAGTLAGLIDHIPYLQELGITYLHLMPLFRAPQPNNDGGYAVSSFREIDPKLGTMDDLRRVANVLRERGISLVVDFVFNHTSDEHEWALRALSGDTEYQAYYRMFDDRRVPDEYAPFLREIFPEQAPGSFTFRPEIKKWVWTTFNTFQWDLNYENPHVFRAMLGEMLFLANQGIEILRLDAVPFVWKEPGTPSENLPQVHTLIEAFNAAVRIAAPSLLFKSEAIVHPRDINSYIGLDECQLSYNPTLMVCLWEALATRKITFMRTVLQRYFPIPRHCAWINYVRSHDDIGWGFPDEEAALLGVNGSDHRHFLNLYFLGKFPGSFARGLPFNFNPITQDIRISGTTASLAGLEAALESGDVSQIDYAVRRIVLMQSVVASIGGIPLLYLGDELGFTNDYSYRDDPVKALDNRWVHRPQFDWAKAEDRYNSATVAGRLFQEIKRLFWLRKDIDLLSGSAAEFVDVGNPHVFAYVRNGKLLVLANFSEVPQVIGRSMLPGYFASRPLIDLVTDTIHSDDVMELAVYGFLWLVSEGG